MFDDHPTYNPLHSFSSNGKTIKLSVEIFFGFWPPDTLQNLCCLYQCYQDKCFAMLFKTKIVFVRLSVCLSIEFSQDISSVCVGRNLFWGKHNFSIWFFDVTYTSHTSVSPSVSLGLPWGLSIRCHPPVVIVVVQDLMLIRVFLARLTISLIIICSLTFV